MSAPTVFAQAYFHGTRADLRLGDEIRPGHPSNFTDGTALNHSYFTATLDAAIWGAELARGSGRERIYLVEPLGEVEDDPNVTDKKFPGNPTLSYRSRQPLRIVGEVTLWQGHPPDSVAGMRASLEAMVALGRSVIID